MNRIRIGIPIATLLLFALGSCSGPAPLDPPPAPSDDPAHAFPRFDAVYRNAGHRAGKNSGMGNRAGVRYFRFFADGTVRMTNLVTGSTGRVTAAMHEEAFAALGAKEADGKVLVGRLERKGEDLEFRLSATLSADGKQGRARQRYRGKVRADQLLLTRMKPDEDARMSPEITYWPIVP